MSESNDKLEDFKSIVSEIIEIPGDMINFKFDGIKIKKIVVYLQDSPEDKKVQLVEIFPLQKYYDALKYEEDEDVSHR